MLFMMGVPPDGAAAWEVVLTLTLTLTPTLTLTLTLQLGLRHASPPINPQSYKNIQFYFNLNQSALISYL